MKIIEPSDNIKEILENDKSENKLSFFYFTASWCGPCQRIFPVLLTLENEYNKSIKKEEKKDKEEKDESKDTDEDTEESPFGTQYSLEDTQKVPDYSDMDLDDIEDFGTFEDDSEEEFEDDSEDEEDEGIISKIRKFFSRK